ncbi:hypothetical protein AAC387_Pa02g2128 [Persea americana]
MAVRQLAAAMVIDVLALAANIHSTIHPATLLGRRKDGSSCCQKVVHQAAGGRARPALCPVQRPATLLPPARHSLLHHSAGHVFLAANTAPFPAEPQPFPSANTLDFSCSRPVNLPIPAASPLGLSSLPPLAANTLLTHRPAAACSGCQLLRAAARNESDSNRRT